MPLPVWYIPNVREWLFMGKDKVAHYFVCFFSTVLISIAFFWLGKVASVICGALFSLGLGLGKEYGDSKAVGNKWDWLDIVADCLGILTAVSVVILGWRD